MFLSAALLSTLLSANPATPLAVHDPTPLRAVHEEGGWMQPALLCASPRGLAYVAPGPELRLLEGGKVAERVPLAAKEEPPDANLGETADWDCGMGRCDRLSRRRSADAKRTFGFHQHRSNYFQDWEPETTLRELTTGGLRADCPGGRPLLQCFTAKRTVLVTLGGDPNDEAPTWTVEYSALAHDGKETLHVSGGKVTRTATGFQVAFANKGYGYVLQASADPKAPAASLQVLKGKAPLQEEPCLAYALYPAHLGWFAAAR